MAAFADDEANRSRVDFRILRDGGLRLYHSASILEEDLLGLQGEGYTILGFDCRAWRSEADFHEDVADVLKFPEYYGRNLDAFNDCMGDVVVPEQGGLALVFRAVESAGFRDGKFFPVVLDILAGVSRTNLLFGRRMIALLQSANPRIEFSPVGAVPVTWNPQEWLGSQRGT